MAGLQNVQKKAGQTMKQAVQATAQQIKNQSREIVSDATQQVGVPAPTEQGVEGHSSGGGKPQLAQDIKSQGSNQLNADEIHRREQELLQMWRSRLAQIKSGEDQAHEERNQQYEAWQKQQQELMNPEGETQQTEELIVPTSKPSGPNAQKGASRVKSQIASKRETGKNFKN